MVNKNFGVENLTQITPTCHYKKICVILNKLYIMMTLHFTLFSPLRDICVAILYIFFLITPFISFAQEADDYAFATNTNSNFITLNNPKQLLGSGLVLTSSPPTPLGFEMWFMGVRYTDFSVNSNGVVQLGTIPLVPEGNAYNIPNRARIVAFAAGSPEGVPPNSRVGDWKIADNGNIQYQTFGNAPNRVVVIQCNNLLVNKDVQNETATFQIWLYETAPLPNTTQGGKIEFRYGVVQCGVENLTATRIGIGDNDRNNTFKGVDLTPPAPTAKIGTASVDNTLQKGNVPFLHSPNPNSLRVFTFESPSPNGQAFNLKANAPDNTKIILNWEENASNEVGSVIYKSTNGMDYTFFTQVNGSTTFTDTEVVPCVNYFYRVYTVTEGKLGILQPTASLTFQISPTLKIDIAGSLLSCPSNPSSVKEIEAIDENNSFESFFWLNSKKDIVGKEKTFSPAQNDTYTLIGKTSAGCTATKSFTTTECCEVLVVIPTAFTPFNTPANNLFFVRAENVTTFYLQIYNRWGIKVFDSNDSGIAWNGTFYDGQPLQAGAYQVIVEYSGCKEGRTVKEKAMAVLYLID
jgi:gliding motility-associated-like protein